MATDAVAIHNSYGNKIDTSKQNEREDIAKREEEGNGDQKMEIKDFNIPMVDASFVGYEIDIMFEYDDG